MTNRKSPSAIAREALKQLSARKPEPTPANYQAHCNEIADLPNSAGFPEAPLRQLSLALAARNPDRHDRLAPLDSAIEQHSWAEVQKALIAFSVSASTPELGARKAVPIMSKGIMAKVALLIENMLPALGSDDARFSGQVAGFLHVLRDPSENAPDIEALLSNFSRRVAIAAEDQAEIRAMLLRLLQLIIENIGGLTLDDNWLKGQIEALLIAVMPPLNLRRLDDVERRIKDVMSKQTEAKGRSMEAQEEMRKMLAAFIEQLSVMNTSSNMFQDRIEESARQIERVKTIDEMTPLLKDVIDATHGMAEDTRRAQHTLESLQERVVATEAEVVKLHLELDQASALARYDPLTDVLNRKGLNEALAREIAGMRRKETPLCIAMLDIDNFKMLNDRLGHETGDDALLHLVKVTRDCMRPVDSLARYGGEEFVVLMPDTALEQGIQTMMRLQRKLTKTFFLADTEKILITFSAGVAQMTSEESGADAIKRADQAMYLAKRAGKNRVFGG